MRQKEMVKQPLLFYVEKRTRILFFFYSNDTLYHSYLVNDLSETRKHGMGC